MFKCFRFRCTPMIRLYSSCNNNYSCKLLVIGGGAGGCSVAWRFSRKLKKNDIIVLEPSQFHYYQPLFTLVAAGVKQLRQCRKPLQSVLPKNVYLIKDRAEDFDPCNNRVYTRYGHKINYEYMVIAVGLKNDYDEILGLKRALDNPASCVSTIYSPEYCTKTWCCIKNLAGGHALFTFPKRAGKCSGAAQKIMYLADDYFRKHQIRSKINITYNTAGDEIFGVPKYAKTLREVACRKHIAVNCNMDLVELTDKDATFLDKNGETITLPYNFLHVSPPMSPPKCLSRCEELVDVTGFLDVDKHTLQHRTFNNIFGVGDCTNTPNSKTAAAVSQQSYVLGQNLSRTMQGKPPVAKYDGYGACPMLTTYNTGILAEFLYDKKVCETFPFDQVANKHTARKMVSGQIRRIITLRDEYSFSYNLNPVKYNI